MDKVAGALLARHGLPGQADHPLPGRFTPTEALAWLDAEEASVLGVFELSEQLGQDEYTALMAYPIGVLALYRGLWEIRGAVKYRAACS